MLFCMDSMRIQLRLPRRLLEEIDAAARKNLTSRSNYIREALILRMQGDEYIENQIQSRDSDFNIIKSAHLSRVSKLRVREYKD